LRIFGQGVGEELESYTPAQAQVLSLVNHTHASTAQFADDAVVGDGFANDKLTSRIWRMVGLDARQVKPSANNFCCQLSNPIVEIKALTLKTPGWPFE